MKILIVDDESLVRRSLQKAFTAHGHTVITAEEGLSGLNLWQKEKPDLVILDVLMPGLTGPEIIEKIDLSLKSKTKVVVISAYAGEFNDQLKENKNFDLYLAKPFDDIMQIVKITEELFTLGKHGNTN